jgi:hypothetical protein
MRYLVFQVGCIECGVPSYPVAVCTSLVEARDAAKAHPSTWDSEGGDGFVCIVDLSSCALVEDEE